MRMEEWIAKYFQPMDFALVTGTTSGIGHEYAKALAKAGCNLICVSNEAESLEAQKQLFEKTYNIKVRNITLDLRDIDQTKQVANEIAELPVKILVNNAGFGLKGRFEQHSVQDYIDIVNVNTIAPIVFTRAILPKMQEEGRGIVIHIASINAIVPIPNNQVYTATKSFCSSYASAVARENKHSKIRFQLVLPGTTKTPFHDRQGANPKSMVMLPEDVVSSSFRNVNRSVCIPNPADRVIAKIVPFLPKNFAMDLAAYLLKRRLGV